MVEQIKDADLSNQFQIRKVYASLLIVNFKKKGKLNKNYFLFYWKY